MNFWDEFTKNLEVLYTRENLLLIVSICAIGHGYGTVDL